MNVLPKFDQILFSESAAIQDWVTGYSPVAFSCCLAKLFKDNTYHIYSIGGVG